MIHLLFAILITSSLHAQKVIIESDTLSLTSKKKNIYSIPLKKGKTITFEFYDCDAKEVYILPFGKELGILNTIEVKCIGSKETKTIDSPTLIKCIKFSTIVTHPLDKLIIEILGKEKYTSLKYFINNTAANNVYILIPRFQG